MKFCEFFFISDTDISCFYLSPPITFIKTELKKGLTALTVFIKRKKEKKRI